MPQVKESNVPAGMDPEDETLIREAISTLIQEVIFNLIKVFQDGEHCSTILYQCSKNAAKKLFEQLCCNRMDAALLPDYIIYIIKEEIVCIICKEELVPHIKEFNVPAGLKEVIQEAIDEGITLSKKTVDNIIQHSKKTAGEVLKMFLEELSEKSLEDISAEEFLQLPRVRQQLEHIIAESLHSMTRSES